jgi:urate oxidase / 2-oxo-4-hydroxy-4-carboxy-5-ureidoimidazoline decarboxylase
VNQFASGTKRNYYGKGDVTVYRLHRLGNQPEGRSPVFAANVKMLIYGDAFWPTYTTGDNTGLVATDSMKNFIQRETLHFDGGDLESYCHFLAEKFLATYPQAEGAQVSAVGVPYAFLPQSAVSFAPSGPDRPGAQVELKRDGKAMQLVEARSSITGVKLLRLGGSAFYGFVRDEYTTLPDIQNRPLHMWLDLDWTYTSHLAAFNNGSVAARVRGLVHELFNGFESGSIQQIIYLMGTKILSDIATISEVRLEANNRTWDTIAEHNDEIGVYTDPRPPYGCLGLTLRR